MTRAMSRVMACPALRDPGSWLQVAACLFLGAALLFPTLPHRRATYSLLAVVDITGSMNVRDYTLDGRPASRLEEAKAALLRMMSDLPCGSRLGLALFTERRDFLLLEPVEICENFSALEDAIRHIDWRMGWEGESHISEGLARGVTLAHSVGSDLLFFSDGQEEPPLPWTGQPASLKRDPRVRGLILGMGGTQPVPIPKFDDNGREIGFWADSDMPTENYAAPPPPGAAQREGYNPRNAPFGASRHTGMENLSSVQTAYLEQLAAGVGLDYRELDSPGQLAGWVERVAHVVRLAARANIAWIFGMLALICMTARMAWAIGSTRK
ncbi:vWA domain-containing protein [Acidomonas methanolica]|uniref:VWFA domain-containing protein n=2 Tax=Acidomonas methanolica TaxID=437 RepID=A0A023D634_ACIMT|nr:vWA domain-containing protein [Acidomonas methanolica]MBU2655459.1 VWA domain-containing protein [Acidomonas methanolica]TCS24445.1 mxaL protein [Acidomonas methanolica]BAN85796.1 hypothetical protein [Acidomonas methanolica]GAJ29256.1 hypothetical protein Amme_057_013 [Acidomonas methanolica NBRC 104435]GBQ50209.1 hypothetical protein AA0498_1168 [Acidomonas methanolica]